MWFRCIISQSCVVGWIFREDARWGAAKYCACMHLYLPRTARKARKEFQCGRWFCGWMLISAVSDIQLGVAGAVFL